MPSITLFHMDLSPPCRTVRSVAAHLGLKLNLRVVDLNKGEHKTEEFLRMNPEHTIPTIKDGDFILWESYAIATYLVSKYEGGKDDDSLYPTDPQVRALVNRLMLFDMAKLYKAFSDYAYPVLFFGASKFDPALKEKLLEALQLLENYLSKGNKFAVGDTITVADHCLAVSVTTIKACRFVDMSKFKKIGEWLERCSQQIPQFEEINIKTTEEFTAVAEEKIKATQPK